MKITNMNLYQVPSRQLLLEIETDEGITGWGEPVIEGRASIVKTAAEDFSGYLIGKDPLRIGDHWQVMYKGGSYRGGPEVMSATAGIDQALWNIKGKCHNASIYELLGGRCGDRLRVYNWIGGDRPGDVRQGVLKLYKIGCTAAKTNGTEEMYYVDSYEKIQEMVNRVASIREALGYKMDIGVDFHGRVRKTMTKALAKELEPFKLTFIEKPVPSWNNEALREIAGHTSTPIATGERIFSRWEFKNLLTDGYVGIIQLDLSHAGGISGVKRIAVMAEAFDVAVAPRCPLGSVALAACVQSDACTPNAFIQEQSSGIHYSKEGVDLLDYLVDPNVFRLYDGFIDIPGGPDPGTQLNKEKIVGAARIGYNWKNPVWCNYDGTMAEW